MSGFKDVVRDSVQTVKGIVKIAMLSHGGRVPRIASCGKTLVVMGNGPSLAADMADNMDLLSASTTMTVNFSVNAPEFTLLKPRFHVLADPHFFNSEESNVEALWRNLAAVSWEMILLVPYSFFKAARRRLGDSVHVSVSGFNCVGVEGFGSFRRAVYRRGLGMPRPRNVLIPSIMLGMALGYEKIVLLGADHSWMRTLSVTSDNEVVSVQPHFYKEEKREEERVRHEYRGYRLHDIVDSFAVAFRGYHDIAAYAMAEGVDIVNATPGSFIDAFRRTTLDEAIKNKR